MHWLRCGDAPHRRPRLPRAARRLRRRVRARRDAKPQLTVSAAASLKTAITDYGTRFDAATVRASFAGSDELAAQIRQGVKPDVFASANTKLPDQLYEEGLVEKPVVFAANELVLAVPADGTVTSLDDLAKPGTTIAMGSESVPVGSYTRKVLDGLPADAAQGDPGQRALQRARRRAAWSARSPRARSTPASST